jgi:hypothetical protein
MLAPELGVEDLLAPGVALVILDIHRQDSQ